MGDNLRRIMATIRSAQYSESDSYNNDYVGSDLHRRDIDYYYGD